MSDCRVPMPTYEPIGEVVEELKRKVDDLRAEVNAKDERIRELECEGAAAFYEAAYTQDAMRGLICDMYADFQRIFDGGKKLEYEERMAALGIEVD